MSKIFLGDTLISGSVPATAAGSFSAGDPMVLTDSGEVRSAADAFSQLSSDEKLIISKVTNVGDPDGTLTFQYGTSTGSFENGDFFMVAYYFNLQQGSVFYRFDKDLNVSQTVKSPTDQVFKNSKGFDGSEFISVSQSGSTTLNEAGQRVSFQKITENFFNYPRNDRYYDTDNNSYTITLPSSTNLQYNTDGSLSLIPIELGTLNSKTEKLFTFLNTFDVTSTSMIFPVYKFDVNNIGQDPTFVSDIELTFDSFPTGFKPYAFEIVYYESGGEERSKLYLFNPIADGGGGAIELPNRTSITDGLGNPVVEVIPYTWSPVSTGVGLNGYFFMEDALRTKPSVVHEDPQNINNTTFYGIAYNSNDGYLKLVKFDGNSFGGNITNSVTEIGTIFDGVSSIDVGRLQRLYGSFAVTTGEDSADGNVLKVIDLSSQSVNVVAKVKFDTPENFDSRGGGAEEIFNSSFTINNRDEILVPGRFDPWQVVKITPNLNFVGFAENSGTTGDDVTIAQPEQVTEAVTGFNQGDEIRMRWDGTLSTEAGVPVGEVLANGKVKILEGQW